MIKKVKTTRVFFGIVILMNMIIFFLMRYNAYKNICIVIDNSFQESIIIDYNNRINKERISSSGTPSNKKVTHVNIQTEQGLEEFEFKDSIEIYKAILLTEQYMLLKTNPLNPHDFNAIFHEELSKAGLEGKTMIIYHYNNVAHSTEKDFASFENTIASPKIYIDAKETAAVQGWVDCNLIMYFKYTSPWIYVLFMITNLGIASLYYFSKKKENSSVTNLATQTTKNSTITAEKEIYINHENKEVYIQGKMLRTTPMTFSIIQLLAKDIDTFIPRAQIEKVLWENPEKEDPNVVGNRLNQNLSILRNDLKNFPQYQILYERGKGYKLTKTIKEDETPET